MAHRDLLLANARVVLAERVIEAGWVAAVNGVIVEIGVCSRAGAVPQRLLPRAVTDPLKQSEIGAPVGC